MVDFVTGFPAVAIGPFQQNLLAMLLWAVLGTVCLYKLKEASDREIVMWSSLCGGW